MVVLTLNEERDLPRCLSAIPAGVRKLVIDSGSTDATVETARAMGATVVSNDWDGFAAQRNFSLTHPAIVTDWVLFIDADEVFEPPFWDWAEDTLVGDPDFDAVFIDSRLILDGVMLRFAPGYPIYHVRLVRHTPGAFVVGNAGHNETVRDDLRVIQLDIPYLHYWHDGPLQPWMRKHIKLAEMEVDAAAQATRPGHLTLRARVNSVIAPGPARIIARFLYHYVARAGFLDGRAGLRYAYMYAWYEMTKWRIQARR